MTHIYYRFEIVEDLQAALAQFAEIAQTLKRNPVGDFQIGSVFGTAVSYTGREWIGGK